MNGALSQSVPTARPALEARGLGWRVGHRWVLRQVDATVPSGSLVGLTGANGAGKSVLLRLLASLEAPSQGVVRVLGWQTTRQAAQVRRRVGYLPESGGLYDRLTVVQNLDFVARAHGLDRETRAAVVGTLLDVTGLGDLAGCLGAALSPGQRRRAALATALVHDPPVLLLDRPLDGLDGPARLEQAEVLRELRQMGKTIVVASTLVAELASLCDELIVLDEGRIAWRGTPAQLEPALDEETGPSFDVAAFDRALVPLLAGERRP